MDAALPDNAPLGIPGRVWATIRQGKAVIAVEPIDADPHDTVIVCATPEPHASALAAGDVMVDGGISDAAPAVFVRFQPDTATEVPELTLDLDLSDPVSRSGVWQLARQEIVVVSFVDSLRARLIDQRALVVDEWREEIEATLRAADEYFLP